MGRLDRDTCFPRTAIEKPREKASRLGLSSLRDEELLALLLDTGNRKENVVLLAKRILQEKGGLSGVFFPAGTLETYGVGTAKAYRLLAVGEIYRRLPFVQREKITDSRRAYALAKGLVEHWEKEYLIVFYLNREKEILEKLVLTDGERGKVDLSLSSIVRRAILTQARFLLLCHNHPSGHLLPSLADIATSENLSSSLALAEVVFLDSLIMTDKDYFSFRRNQIGPFRTRPRENGNGKTKI